MMKQFCWSVLGEDMGKSLQILHVYTTLSISVSVVTVSYWLRSVGFGSVLS